MGRGGAKETNYFAKKKWGGLKKGEREWGTNLGR